MTLKLNLEEGRKIGRPRPARSMAMLPNIWLSLASVVVRREVSDRRFSKGRQIQSTKY